MSKKGHQSSPRKPTCSIFSSSLLTLKLWIIRTCKCFPTFHALIVSAVASSFFAFFSFSFQSSSTALHTEHAVSTFPVPYADSNSEEEAETHTHTYPSLSSLFLSACPALRVRSCLFSEGRRGGGLIPSLRRLPSSYASLNPPVMIFDADEGSGENLVWMTEMSGQKVFGWCSSPSPPQKKMELQIDGLAWPDRPRCGTYILPTVASLLEMQRLKGNPTSQNLKPIGEFNQEIQTSWLYRNSPSALIGSWHHFYILSALSICTVLCSSWLWLWVRDSIEAREGTLKSFLTVWFSFYFLRKSSILLTAPPYKERVSEWECIGLGDRCSDDLVRVKVERVRLTQRPGLMVDSGAKWDQWSRCIPGTWLCDGDFQADCLLYWTSLVTPL